MSAAWIPSQLVCDNSSAATDGGHVDIGFYFGSFPVLLKEDADTKLIESGEHNFLVCMQADGKHLLVIKTPQGICHSLRLDHDSGAYAVADIKDFTLDGLASECVKRQIWMLLDSADDDTDFTQVEKPVDTTGGVAAAVVEEDDDENGTIDTTAATVGGSSPPPEQAEQEDSAAGVNASGSGVDIINSGEQSELAQITEMIETIDVNDAQASTSESEVTKAVQQQPATPQIAVVITSATEPNNDINDNQDNVQTAVAAAVGASAPSISINGDDNVGSGLVNDGADENHDDLGSDVTVALDNGESGDNVIKAIADNDPVMTIYVPTGGDNDVDLRFQRGSNFSLDSDVDPISPSIAHQPRLPSLPPGTDHLTMELDRVSSAESTPTNSPVISRAQSQDSGSPSTKGRRSGSLTVPGSAGSRSVGTSDEDDDDKRKSKPTRRTSLLGTGRGAGFRRTTMRKKDSGRDKSPSRADSIKSQSTDDYMLPATSKSSLVGDLDVDEARALIDRAGAGFYRKSEYDETRKNLDDAESWDQFVAPEIVATCNKKEIKRQSVIYETIKLEQTYVADMHFLVEILDGLSQHKIITEGEIGMIFSNAKEVYRVSEKFCEALVGRLLESPAHKIKRVDDLFLVMAPELQCYTSFCSSTQDAKNVVTQISERNREFRTYIDGMQKDERARKLDLKSFLSFPMQHITRYPMLLESIQKIDVETDANENSYIEAATLEIKAIAQLVNQVVRNKDQNARALVFATEFGLPVKITAKNADRSLHFLESFVGVVEFSRLKAAQRVKNRQVVIVEDTLLVLELSKKAKQKLKDARLAKSAALSDAINVKDLKLDRKIDLNYIVFDERFFPDPDRKKIAFMVPGNQNNGTEVFEIEFDSVEQRRLWANNLNMRLKFNEKRHTRFRS